MSGRAAVFLDRDGILNELVPDPASGRHESPLHPRDVRLIPSAAAAAAQLRAAGFVLAIVTNQPAAAKGRVAVAELRATHERVLARLEEEGAAIDDWRMCLHHPDGVVAELAWSCDCRKPAPGMLLELASELSVDLASSWMVGDTDADVLAGQAAGCRTIQVCWAPSAHKRAGSVDPDYTVADLAEAANVLTALGSRT